eukprot:SAG31_NODE_150_length_22290_cov_5.975801_5_plen_167_part_00
MGPDAQVCGLPMHRPHMMRLYLTTRRGRCEICISHTRYIPHRPLLSSPGGKHVLSARSRSLGSIWRRALRCQSNDYCRTVPAAEPIGSRNRRLGGFDSDAFDDSMGIVGLWWPGRDQGEHQLYIISAIKLNSPALHIRDLLRDHTPIISAINFNFYIFSDQGEHQL